MVSCALAHDVYEADCTEPVTFPTAPRTTVTPSGDIKYEEVNRSGVSRLEKYVAEMAAGSKITAETNVGLVGILRSGDS